MKLVTRGISKDNLKRIKGMGKDNFFGTMESIIQGNGMKAQKMGKVIGNQLQEKAIWANG